MVGQSLSRLRESKQIMLHTMALPNLINMAAEGNHTERPARTCVPRATYPTIRPIIWHCSDCLRLGNIGCNHLVNVW